MRHRFVAVEVRSCVDGKGNVAFGRDSWISVADSLWQMTIEPWIGWGCRGTWARPKIA